MRKAIFFICLLLISFLLAEDCDDYCLPPSTKEEYALLKNIHSESKRLYYSLDCKGKNAAVAYAKQGENKNVAIQKAAKEMAVRQREEYPNQKNYQQQVQERSGQYLYNERFGN